MQPYITEDILQVWIDTDNKHQDKLDNGLYMKKQKQYKTHGHQKYYLSHADLLNIHICHL